MTTVPPPTHARKFTSQVNTKREKFTSQVNSLHLTGERLSVKPPIYISVLSAAAGGSRNPKGNRTMTKTTTAHCLMTGCAGPQQIAGFCTTHYEFVGELIAAERGQQAPADQVTYTDWRRAAALLAHFVAEDGQNLDGLNAVLAEASEDQRVTQLIGALLGTMVEVVPLLRSEDARVVLANRVHTFARAEAGEQQ